jgi:hypothetical protein
MKEHFALAPTLTLLCRLKQGDKKGQENWKEAWNKNTKAHSNDPLNNRQYEPLRPTTSYSTKGPNSWRQTFKGLGANSSMVDLSASMRKGSIGNPQTAPSESSLRGQWSSGSSTNLPLPSSLGGHGLRVGTPERPSTSSGRTKEWINPLDVHFARETPGAGTSPQAITPAPKSPLALEVNADEVSDDKRGSDNTQSSHGTKNFDKYHPTTNHDNGYPSPPQSISNGDQSLSPDTPDLSNGSSHFTTPGGPSSLPSPAPSATSLQQTSDERWDVPVIRNVMAKRDTTTFHSPRRRSFTKDVEVEELERLRKQQQTEGFAGNFSAFDFGETVTRQPSREPQPEQEVVIENVDQEKGVPKEEPKEEPQPFISPHIAPFLSQDMEFPKVPRRRSSGPQVVSGVFEQPPPAPVEKPADVPTRPVTSYDNMQRVAAPPAAAAGAHPGNGVESFERPPLPLGFRVRLGSDASARRQTGPPRPLRPAAELVPQQSEPSIKSPNRPPSDKSITATDAPKKSLETSPMTAYKKPIEGDFPVTKGLPRGRQPPRRPPRSDEVIVPEKPQFAIPEWDGFNRTEPRRSAIPPPLSPAKQGRPSTSSAVAPQLPSPSFASFGSLELSISNSGDSLTKAFEDALGKSSHDTGFADDFFAFEGDASPTNTETRASRFGTNKAPSQPPSIGLPPSPTRSAEAANKSSAPTPGEFSATLS